MINSEEILDKISKFMGYTETEEPEEPEVIPEPEQKDPPTTEPESEPEKSQEDKFEPDEGEKYQNSYSSKRTAIKVSNYENAIKSIDHYHNSIRKATIDPAKFIDAGEVTINGENKDVWEFRGSVKLGSKNVPYYIEIIPDNSMINIVFYSVYVYKNLVESKEVNKDDIILISQVDMKELSRKVWIETEASIQTEMNDADLSSFKINAKYFSVPLSKKNSELIDKENTIRISIRNYIKKHENDMGAIRLKYKMYIKLLDIKKEGRGTENQRVPFSNSSIKRFIDEEMYDYTSQDWRWMSKKYENPEESLDNLIDNIIQEQGHYEVVGDYPGALKKVKKKRTKDNLSFIKDTKSKERFKKWLSQ